MSAIIEACTNCNGSTEERVINLTGNKGSWQASDRSDVRSAVVEL